MPQVTHAQVRMYRMGTGDCFAVKFFAGEQTVFRLLIDAGAWSGSRTRLSPYIESLKQYLDDYADVLLVTHEHQDHVLAFETCAPLFTDGRFHVGELWLGWPENDGNRKVQEWKRRYGEKKKALGLAAAKLMALTHSPGYKKQFAGSFYARQALAARQRFSRVLQDFADLHLSRKGKTYKGGLAGMEVVKHQITRQQVRFFKPGEVISDLGEATGLKAYVLGPPERFGDVGKETGGAQETFDPNLPPDDREAFAAAILQLGQSGSPPDSLLPFDAHYLEPAGSAVQRAYEQDDWRRIDTDWLYSAGSFALRLNSLTNNLSLALAFELGPAGKVLLFPGDAEYGSWASWHRIRWPDQRPESPEEGEAKHLTEDLLNRTVFYKVAHHLSHNGTARKLGLEMMTHPDLTAMATLDYGVIPAGWTSTMPNQMMVKELLARTKGRLLVLNEAGLFADFNREVPLSDKIREARSSLSARERQAFEDSLEQTRLYIQYTVQA